MPSDATAVVLGASERAIPKELYDRLVYVGILDPTGTRKYNVGESNYSKHLIQPWAVWIDYQLDGWDCDIVKRVLRTKGDDEAEWARNRILDYEKIIHICKEKLRQLKLQQNGTKFQ